MEQKTRHSRIHCCKMQWKALILRRIVASLALFILSPRPFSPILSLRTSSLHSNSLSWIIVLLHCFFLLFSSCCSFIFSTVSLPSYFFLGSSCSFCSVAQWKKRVGMRDKSDVKENMREKGLRKSCERKKVIPEARGDRMQRGRMQEDEAR